MLRVAVAKVLLFYINTWSKALTSTRASLTLSITCLLPPSKPLRGHEKLLEFLEVARKAGSADGNLQNVTSHFC